MKDSDLKKLIAFLKQSSGSSTVEQFETHASWVIVTDECALKIKKPVHFSFLDFSTLEKRKFYCEKELALNSRFSPDIYIGVVAITKSGDNFELDGEGPVVEYAVKMKRLDNTKRMDVLAEKKDIQPAQMEQLAIELANFHQKTSRPQVNISKNDLIADFDDLFGLQSKLEKIDPISLEPFKGVASSIWDMVFDRWKIRQQKGFYIDGHGDLHARNIFLYPEKAILFDCIEFNDHFRYQDILSELAFLAMDLEFWGLKNLADIFIKKYNQVFPVFENEMDQQLFLYYKMYRANIRLKVYALKNLETESERNELIAYWKLMIEYLKELKLLIAKQG
ncbi:MAG: hypothetical protein R2879_12590 [Saprospiraceae bacterium]